MRPHFPTVNNLAQGFDTTLLLLRLKWRTIRSAYSRIMLLVGVAFMLSLVFLSSSTGLLIKTVAQRGGDTAVQQIAINYLTSFMRGEIGTAGAVILGFSVLSAIIAPLTGSVTTSLFSPNDLVGLRLTRWHRFTDSLLAQFTSSISFLQLVALTAISSILTLQQGQALGMAFTWTVWIVLIFLSTLSVWTVEYLNRRFGLKPRMIILGSIALLIGLAILLFPDQSKTLFGLGTLYAHTVQNIWMFTPANVAAMFGILALLILALFAAGAMMSSLALSYPENFIPRKKMKLFVSTKISTNPWVELFKMFMNNIFRSPEARKPLVASGVLGAIMIAATDGSYTAATTFTILVPLVIGIAWGANVFGVLGGGTVWLASQPKIFIRMPWLMYGVQILFTITLFLIVWLPSIMLGRAGGTNLISVLLAALSTTALVTVMSINKSVTKPLPVNYGVRGESMLPPLTALSYLFKFSIGPGFYGVLVLTMDSPLIQVALTVLALLYSVLRMTKIQEKWENWEHRRDVISKVAQD